MVNVALLSFELFLLWLATLKSILQPSKMPVPYCAGSSEDRASAS